MTPNSPYTPPCPCRLRITDDVRRRVLSAAQLRAYGVSAAEAAARCGAGGPWQQPLPGVYVLHPGPPSDEERLRCALLYAGRPPASRRRGTHGLPHGRPDAGGPSGTGGRTRAAGQAGAEGHAGVDGQSGMDGQARPGSDPGYGEAMLTGLAALALHGFTAAVPPGSPERIDVLVPRTRRLRSVRDVRLVRAADRPRPEQIRGLPVAPVERALADAVSGLTEGSAVHRLLTEAMHGGHAEPAAVVGELSRAGLLDRPHVADAADSLLTEGRAPAEDRLYALVRSYGLPEPLWNVDLRLPGGPHLGAVDAYWPEHAVAVVLDTRAPRHSRLDGDRRRAEHDARWSAHLAQREHLERLGVTVVHLSPKKLLAAAEQQAVVVRTALSAAADRAPAARVIILPR
ncbi:hypothetical protein AB0E67_09920 [Streptomyces sp. NPDC032161]|uniref:hypothetical protein n=1 Tax=unclassified Streptomyces TaxID=2593676 RepID=UPI0033E83779